MHIGAILTVPGGVRLHHTGSDFRRQANGLASSTTTPIAYWDLLGKSILERLRERLQVFGVNEISVISEQTMGPGAQLTSSTTAFWTAWNAVIAQYMQLDLTTLLLMRVGPYLELDIAEFLRFHRETSSPMTQVYDSRSALDVVAVDAKQLAQGSGSFRSRLQGLIPKHERYPFTGYCNRLVDVRDFHRLAEDALYGRAGLRPIGKEIRATVWVGENARIDDSAKISGPAYIGKHSKICPDCVITGSTTIEQNCEVDRGTIVDHSCVLPGSYIGPGLSVCGGVVYQQTFFHLGRNVQLQFRDRRLFGKNVAGRTFLPHRRASMSQVPNPRTFL